MIIHSVVLLLTPQKISMLPIFKITRLENLPMEQVHIPYQRLQVDLLNQMVLRLIHQGMYM
jgi:hypothetical protein